MALRRGFHSRWGFCATLGSSLGKSFPGDRLITLFGGLMIAVALAMAVAVPSAATPLCG